MTDTNIPTAGATGGPDPTPSKILIKPTPLKSVVDPGKAIANGLVISGVAMVVLGFFIWVSSKAYDVFSDDSMAAAVARGFVGLGVMPLGVIVAALGVHAFAVRPRS